MGGRKKQLRIEWFSNHYQVLCIGWGAVTTIHFTDDDKRPLLRLQCSHCWAEPQLKLVEIPQTHETLWRVLRR